MSDMSVPKMIGYIKLLIVVGWVSSVAAAEPVMDISLALPKNLSPWVLILLAAGISFWGGATATVQRWAKAEDNGKWKVLFVRDVMCSQTAGFGAFFTCVHWTVAPPVAALVVLVSAYGGSVVIDASLNRLLKYIETKDINEPKS